MNQSIIKTLYLRAQYETDQRTGKVDKLCDDAILFLIGGDDGSRTLKIHPKPNYTFYVAKEDLRYHRLSVPLEDVTPVTCPYSQRFDYMANAVGLKDQYRNAKKDWRTKKDWIQRNIFNNSQLYHADMDIEDTYKLSFNEKYGDHSADLEYTTSFTDIETRADLGDFEQHKAEVPICSMCHIDSKTETVYVMVLNDPLVPEIRQLFSNLPEYVKHLRSFLNEVREECIVRVKKDKGDVNSIHSFNFNYKFFLLETEAELITKYFSIIKETKPDFCGIWNINFDMIMIKNRAAKLGLNMADLVSDNLIPPQYRYFEYVEDNDRFNTKSQTHYSRYFDKVYTTSATQWYCQMSLHSNLRKRFLENDYKLDSIGEKYAYVKKLDLESKGYHIKDVYVKNFQIFLDYAIMDPIVQFMIERTNLDIPRYMINCKDTKFHNGIRKTYGIKDDLLTFLKTNKNEVIGNNKSYDITESIPGAIVASPSNISKKGINLLGTDTHIYRNCVDFDISSEYPSLTIVYNILKTTLYGRIVNTYYAKDLGKGVVANIPISDGACFNKMLQTLDTSIFDVGQKYYGLPALYEMISHIEKCCLKE